MNRHEKLTVALITAVTLPPDDLRLLLEVLRRVAGGEPIEHVLDAMIGERDAPAARLNS
jgi:hypothetical protein